MKYYFDSHLRYSFGFDNPNEAACLLVMFLGLVYGVELVLSVRKEGSKFEKIFIFMVSCIIWYCLCLTYSRGGFISAIGVSLLVGARWVYHLFSRKVSLSLFDSSKILALTLRIAIIAVSVLHTGFIKRMSVGYVMSDGSVQNRIDLWAGGLKMIYDSRGVGWGFRQGGHFFNQWYKPLHIDSSYLSFVNSYISILVDLGIVVFSGIVFLFMSLLLTSFYPLGNNVWSKLRLPKNLTVVAGAMLFGFLICNSFSTLWDSTPILTLASCSTIFLLGHFLFIRKEKKIRMLLISCLFTLTLSGGLLLTGRILGKVSEISVVPKMKSSSVILTSKGDGIKVKVLCDSVVLGQSFGVTARSLIEKYGKPIELYISDPFNSEDEFMRKVDYDFIIVFGDNWRKLDLLSDQPVILAVPSGSTDLVSKLIFEHLILEASDRHGENKIWREVASNLDAEISVVRFDEVADCILYILNEKS